MRRRVGAAGEEGRTCTAGGTPRTGWTQAALPEAVQHPRRTVQLYSLQPSARTRHVVGGDGQRRVVAQQADHVQVRQACGGGRGIHAT